MLSALGSGEERLLTGVAQPPSVLLDLPLSLTAELLDHMLSVPKSIREVNTFLTKLGAECIFAP